MYAVQIFGAKALLFLECRSALSKFNAKERNTFSVEEWQGLNSEKELKSGDFIFMHFLKIQQFLSTSISKSYDSTDKDREISPRTAFNLVLIRVVVETSVFKSLLIC